jgi:hypothetical protein
VTEPVRLPLPLCRFAGHTCAACCWGDAVRRRGLAASLRRQSRLFRRWFPGPRLPGRVSLLLYELAARGGLDLLLAPLLLVPGLAGRLRAWLKRRTVCAFAGFEDAEGRRVGCLLHPSRWGGKEVRPQVAFALLPGVGCGAPGWYCPSARRFADARWEERRRFARQAAGLDWYAYSRAASTYRPNRGMSGGPPGSILKENTASAGRAGCQTGA